MSPASTWRVKSATSLAAMTEVADPDVAAVFAGYEDAVRPSLLALRRLILDTAEFTDGAGELEETLKWGQPSYLTSQTRSGSTIRLGALGPDSGHDYAMYFICNTNLVDGFQASFGDTFAYEGNRALLFTLGHELPQDELAECVSRALTYHLNKA